MTQREELKQFIERARQTGIADPAVVSLLEANGWSSKEIAAAMREYYEETIGMPVPVRRGVGEGARDAFLHLLGFGTLATWTIALGALLFAFIERLWPDAVTSPPVYSSYPLAENLASLIVAFPIYLTAMRQTLREKRDTGVRRWLTWLALLIAASVVIGDFIAVLTWLLRGEITIRFLMKALVVFILAGGVFGFYLAGLRETGVRARQFAVAAALLVVVGLVAGFYLLGSPSGQRQKQADRRRVEHLREIASTMNARTELPDALTVRRMDPATGRPYEYRRLGGSKYELCATFETAEDERLEWAHPAGRHCYQLDATRPVY